MRRITTLLPILIFTFAVFNLSAEPKRIIESPFVPMSPEVMAQGGSFVAAAHGYNSLFYNPAGFAEKGGSVTLASVNTWIYANPARVYQLLKDMSNPAAAAGLLGLINDQVTSGGFGVGTAMGIGITGRGLGLGAVVMMDSYLYGPTILGIEGDITATIGFIGGLALPVNLFGLNFKIGADVRPMVRVHAPLPNSDALGLIMSLAGGGDVMAALNNADAFHGFGLGLDFGTTVAIGPVKAALAVRDLGGTRFYYTKNTFKEVAEAFGSGGDFPPGEEVSQTDYEFVIPMNVSGGVEFHPDLGILKFIIDPSVHADIQDLIGVIRDKRTLWTLLHIGSEVRLLHIFKVRAGFNQGYITMGGGIKLLFLDFNFALFTRELGRHLGDRPNSGATVEFALRF
ncbi:MAG: hypothetical protein GXP33_13925 [Spirochaetes bacterium]|nr:hypothetical protein [Spirochaetota bacterium]